MSRDRLSLESDSNIIIAPRSDSDRQADFAHAVCSGLEADPRSIPCRFLYDARGSSLFEQICQQPEYYPTRTEASILRENADAIATSTGPRNLMELGSGSSVKTRYLLRAYASLEGDPLYVPVDVSKAALEQARATITSQLPQVRMRGIVGPYEQAFDLFAELSPLLVIFLGSTIGNFEEAETERFFSRLAARLEPGDHLLLGIDLDKDAELLEKAYNDAAGFSAAFTLNLFRRMNDELGARLDLAEISHQAVYDKQRMCIEIHARFRSSQTLHVTPLGKSYRIAAGEKIRTEISRKFSIDEMTRRLGHHGFAVREVYTDRRRWFAVLLLEKGDPR